jgi:hypothetical protein
MTGIKNHFWTFYFKAFIRPSRTFNLILENKNKLRYGFYAFLIPSLGYTVFYYFAYNAGGAPSTFKPWLTLSIEKYFMYDIFLAIPGIFLSLVAAAGIVQLLSRLFNCSGSFEDTFTTFGFGVAIASWATLLHDLIDSFLGFTGVINMQEYEKSLNEPTFWRSLLWTLFLIYFVWFILLFTKGIKASQKTSTSVSIFLGIIGLLVYQSILLIFIR